jgi:hypothetical protein
MSTVTLNEHQSNHFLELFSTLRHLSKEGFKFNVSIALPGGLDTICITDKSEVKLKLDEVKPVQDEAPQPRDDWSADEGQ